MLSAKSRKFIEQGASRQAFGASHCCFSAPKQCMFYSISRHKNIFLPKQMENTKSNDVHYWKGMTKTIF